MTIILRFVSILPTPDEKESYVDIREYFLSFIDIFDTTGAGMTEKILETLDSHGISMQDLRGQGYDNGLFAMEHYRTDEQLQKMLKTARNFSVELDIKPEFKKKRGRTKKRMFAYESQEESMTEEDNFKINFFNSILDHAIGSLQDRLNAKDITEDELLKRCMDLEKLLSCNELKDVSGTDLFEEMKYLRNYYKGNYSPRNILDFICSNNLNAALGNLFVSLRILFSLPVSVATAKRSFSKMKLI
ncbi:uncharacterized protein LOC136089755 [Hydra vulgaris]|uniref:Uncharacterized protein LOC136089755 n=1 Tax=Hydra vulgaris TaxID=6087 RepID=A0ABM4DC30_HYDVU